MTTPIFVYGSLRKGMHNNSILADSEYGGTWQTCEPYFMIGLKSDAFPYVCRYPIFDTTPTPIIGELYHVKDSVLERLDALEGHPHHYMRMKIAIQTGTKRMESYMYMLENMDDIEYIRKNPSRFVPVAGDWVMYLNGKK